jgi:hypothetical protein
MPLASMLQTDGIIPCGAHRRRENTLAPKSGNLRGGASGSDEELHDVQIWSEAGGLLAPRKFDRFIEVALRSLNVKETDDWTFDASLTDPGTLNDLVTHNNCWELQSSMSLTVTKSNFNEEFYNKHFEPHFEAGWHVTVRPQGEEVPYGRPQANSVITIELPGTGVVFWRLPIQDQELAEVPIIDLYPINQVQDSFRAAIEYLLPCHQYYDITAKFPDGEKSMRLAAKAPSYDFYAAVMNQIMMAANQSKLTGIFTMASIAIYVSGDLLQRHKRPEAATAVKIIIPGSFITEIYDLQPDDQAAINGQKRGAAFMAGIRDLAHNLVNHTERSSVRLWSSFNDYLEEHSRSVLLGQNADEEADEAIAQELTWEINPQIVARNNWQKFSVFDARDIKNSVEWADPSWSLESFRRVINLLLADSSAHTSLSLVTRGTMSEHETTFAVPPEMTETQWRLRVFDCFVSSTILVEIPNDHDHGFSELSIL